MRWRGCSLGGAGEIARVEQVYDGGQLESRSRRADEREARWLAVEDRPCAGRVVAGACGGESAVVMCVVTLYKAQVTGVAGQTCHWREMVWWQQ